MEKKNRIYKYIIFIVAYIIFNILISNNVQAVNQTISSDINAIDDSKYPGIKSMMQTLQAEYPNWNFKILYTGLTWEEVIANEYVGHNSSPRNLVTSSHTGDWRCTICGDTSYDNGSWRCASEVAIKYMLDARNSINSSDIFQFLELTYTDCSYESIKTMVSGTFLDNDSYINTIITVAKENDVSAYYIVALILQEQGTNGSSTVSGTYEGYEGYYNIFNINATGNGSDTIIKNALSYAITQDWDTVEKSIKGGVEKIVVSYIGRGQNTLYLQKFDVDNSDGNLYWHQYQQNLLAAQNEGVKIRKIFESIDAINESYTFIIPVYENMPTTISVEPNSSTSTNVISTDIVYVNVNSTLKLRNSVNGDVIGYVYSNEILTRLEKATEKIDGTYWDKVMKSNGTIGYVARETYDTESEYKLYLVPVANEKVENIIDLKTTQIQIESSNKTITMIPGTTLQDLIEAIEFEVTVKDSSGNIIGTTATPGTGYIVNDEYAIVLIGDVNGDGETTALDAAIILRYTVGQYNMSEIQKNAGVLGEEDTPTALDAAKILRYTVGQYNIKIK